MFYVCRNFHDNVQRSLHNFSKQINSNASYCKNVITVKYGVSSVQKRRKRKKNQMLAVEFASTEGDFERRRKININSNNEINGNLLKYSNSLRFTTSNSIYSIFSWNFSYTCSKVDRIPFENANSVSVTSPNGVLNFQHANNVQSVYIENIWYIFEFSYEFSCSSR